MMTEARMLTAEEFKDITKEGLENDRVAIRDVHYTIEKSRYPTSSQFENIFKEMCIFKKWEGGWSSSRVDAFRISDNPNPKCLYFFRSGYSTDYSEFLNPEDVIPSGLFALNESKTNKERVLQELAVTGGASVDSYGVDGADLQKASQYGGNILDHLEHKKVKTAIDSLENIEWAIYNCDPYIEKLLGDKPIMFTKQLGRTDGKILELYNHKNKSWELIPGEPTYFDIGILEQLTYFFTIFMRWARSFNKKTEIVKK